MFATVGPPRIAVKLAKLQGLLPVEPADADKLVALPSPRPLAAVGLLMADPDDWTKPSLVGSLSGVPMSKGLRRERIQASAQFREGKFRNTSGVGPELKGPSFSIMKEFMFGGGKRAPRAPLPVLDPRATWALPPEGLRITWLGHSTLLLEVDGVRVLTDPVFGERASPMSFAGPKRFHPPPALLEHLPPVDAVLLSHDHYDHLCSTTMKQLARMRVPVVTSLGVGTHLESLGVDPVLVTELDWWQEHTLPGGGLSFTATPAQHFSGRGIADRNTTLWSSWVLTSPCRRLFFSGDTGLTPEFADICAQHGPFDVTMLEIGAWHEAWGDIHLGPHNALKAFEMLGGGGTLLPIHWGTFDLALHAWDEPAETLFELARRAGRRMLTPRLGEALHPDRVDEPSPWWRAVQRT